MRDSESTRAVMGRATRWQVVCFTHVSRPPATGAAWDRSGDFLFMEISRIFGETVYVSGDRAGPVRGGTGGGWRVSVTGCRIRHPRDAAWDRYTKRLAISRRDVRVWKPGRTVRGGAAGRRAR